MAQEPVAHIPKLHSTTLSGQTVDLPAALAGKTGVLIVGFSRDSRVQATAWGKRLAVDFGHSNQVVYFELPVIEDVPRLLRGFVLRAIAREVSPTGQAHFAPISTDQAGWKAVTHFADPEVAYVLVVDGSGTVQWQTAGGPEDSRYMALHRAVNDVLAHRPTTEHPTP